MTNKSLAIKWWKRQNIETHGEIDGGIVRWGTLLLMGFAEYLDRKKAREKK